MNFKSVEEYLIKNGKNKTYQEIGELFNKSSESIRHIYRKLKRKNKLEEIQNITETQNYISDLEDIAAILIEEKRDNLKNTSTLTYQSNKPLSPKEIEDLAQVDNINTFVSRTWLKSHKNNTWTYSIDVRYASKEKVEFEDNFIKFLETYKPQIVPVTYTPIETNLEKALLILPKQDAHLNKLDINGENDINKRFSVIERTTEEIIIEAYSNSELEKITYIVGSDQFNSELTGMTTKGTPQQNILDYQQSFELICNHELRVINILLTYCGDVKIIYVPGNHDEYVGFHLINWLKAVYKNDGRITIEDGLQNSKFERYSNTAIMYNHGDVIKYRDLAVLFPVQFKKEWNKCDNFIVFTGDKHHEKSIDYRGINFYQVPAMSGATSKWDDKMGFYSKPEIQAFLVKQSQGITNIYKRQL